jgi:DNA-binding winged helix-turn-helix (wHTH) protein
MRVRFGSFEFDTATRELQRDGARVHLSPKSFDLLQILIARRPALVTKTALQDQLWPDAVVLEANLGNAVAEIRKALGDDPKSPAYVCTVSRRGYRFAANVEVIGGGEQAHRVHSRPRWWLIWKDTILPLAEGDNVVGRSPDSGIWLDGVSVSREHAHIFITDGRAMLEDRRSTNGTYVNGERIAAPQVLTDGAALTFGSEETIFREWSDTAAPATEPVRSPLRSARRHRE